MPFTSPLFYVTPHFSLLATCCFYFSCNLNFGFESGPFWLSAFLFCLATLIRLLHFFNAGTFDVFFLIFFYFYFWLWIVLIFLLILGIVFSCRFDSHLKWKCNLLFLLRCDAPGVEFRHAHVIEEWVMEFFNIMLYLLCYINKIGI